MWIYPLRLCSHLKNPVFVLLNRYRQREWPVAGISPDVTGLAIWSLTSLPPLRAKLNCARRFPYTHPHRVYALMVAGLRLELRTQSRKRRLSHKLLAVRLISARYESVRWEDHSNTFPPPHRYTDRQSYTPGRNRTLITPQSRTCRV